MLTVCHEPTKQEEIREGLERFYKAGNLTPTNVLFFLEKRGVVLKVDRELPINTCGDDYDCYESCHLIAQEDMLKAGYVATEPIVKEE